MQNSRDFYPRVAGFFTLKSGDFYPRGLRIFEKSEDFYPRDWHNEFRDFWAFLSRDFLGIRIFWGWGFFGDRDLFSWDDIPGIFTPGIGILFCGMG